VFCKSCGNVFRPDQVGLCPKCGVRKHEILSGTKLMIKQIGFR
ncbi:MAG: hydrogenase maturation nickel metallochaperone HypA, partial [Clostridia bacterium]|nr:hydrogenase maturation nickel metallochaperone HypA [Clostridia bacterium]